MSILDHFWDSHLVSCNYLQWYYHYCQLLDRLIIKYWVLLTFKIFFNSKDFLNITNDHEHYLQRQISINFCINSTKLKGQIHTSWTNKSQIILTVTSKQLPKTRARLEKLTEKKWLDWDNAYYVTYYVRMMR